MPKHEKISQEEKANYYKEVTPIAIRERKKLFKDNTLENEICILEQLGFVIVKFPSKDKNLSGFCINKSGFNCIYINSNTTRGRQKFSLWHEYYHLITGDGIGISYKDGEKYDKSECKAHLFAGVFIMPRNLVDDYIKENRITMPFIKNVEILKMSNIFNVSFAAMLYRIIELYPKHKNDLNKRFSTANNYSKLEELANKSNISIENEKITNDFYISKIFFDQIERNYTEKKITDEKLQSIKELLEKVKGGNNV